MSGPEDTKGRSITASVMCSTTDGHILHAGQIRLYENEILASSGMLDMKFQKEWNMSVKLNHEQQLETEISLQKNNITNKYVTKDNLSY